MGNEGLHEPRQDLSPEVLDRHRAIESLREELEAVDWYDQRAAATQDEELRAILIHNRDEEKEHAAMVLEWIRRHDATFDAHLRQFLFQDGPPLSAHGADDHGDSTRPSSLELGGLKLRTQETH